MEMGSGVRILSESVEIWDLESLGDSTALLISRSPFLCSSAGSFGWLSCHTMFLFPLFSFSALVFVRVFFLAKLQAILPQQVLGSLGSLPPSLLLDTATGSETGDRELHSALLLSHPERERHLDK